MHQMDYTTYQPQVILGGLVYEAATSEEVWSGGWAWGRGSFVLYRTPRGRYWSRCSRLAPGSDRVGTVTYTAYESDGEALTALAAWDVPAAERIFGCTLERA